MKIKKSIQTTMIFLLVLCVVYYVHISVFGVNVVLYSAAEDCLFSVLIVGSFLDKSGCLKSFNPFEKSQLLTIWLLLSFLMAVTVPTLIDRSLSFYILEKLQQRGGGIRQERFDEVLREYAREHRLADVRLTEQQESGTITVRDGCVQLTHRGETLASFGRFFRQNLLPRQRLLLGAYSDDLTDPFRRSEASPGYECH